MLSRTKPYLINVQGLGVGSIDVCLTRSVGRGVSLNHFMFDEILMIERDLDYYSWWGETGYIHRGHNLGLPQHLTF